MGGPASGGHNRKSIEAHLSRGTYRPDRHGQVVPLTERPAEPAPAPPAGLSAAASALWGRIVAQYDGWSAHELFL